MDADEAEQTVNVADVNSVYLMRHLLSTRLVEKEKLISVYKTLFPHDANAEELSDAVNTVNGLLQNAKMEVKKVHCEVSKRLFYVVISTAYRPDRLWPSNRTEDELEFIKRVIHEMMISGRGIATSMHCLNLDVKLSKTDRENLIKSLIAEKWFTETKKGTLAMSAACIAELEPYLKNNYREILTKCLLCKRVVYFGEICSNCNSVVHRLCLEQYLKTHKKCSSCGKSWAASKSQEQYDEMDCDE